jgi:preprotein translocase subunit SecY
VAGLSKSDTSQSIVGAFSNMFGFWYNLFCNVDRIYILYTAITVPTNKMSDDLKRRMVSSVLDRGLRLQIFLTR